ncbi:MAG: hypothetical protein ACI379_15190 [Nocardioides sp.]|uniref:hypothetical protein n=1 Tax=Nocardioides sp. TaxID=35761 RepID=UPI003F0184B1
MALTLTSREPAIVYGAPPRVDLLPPAEKDRRSLAQLKRRWVLAVLAVLGAAALVVLAALALRFQASLSVGAAEDHRAELQSDLAQYSDVSGLVSERDALVGKRAQAMAADMSWTKPYRLLAPALPNGARLTGFSAASGGEASADPADLGLKAVVTVSSGRAIDQAIVLDAFAQVEHVADVDMLGLEQAEGVYTYRIYVAFDQGIYNKRFQTGAATQEDGQ